MVCVVSSRFRRLSCGGVVLTSSALDEFSEWLAMVSKFKKGVLGSRARNGLKECWQMRSRIDGRKEWTCKFCWESNVWTRWRCRGCYSNIRAGFQLALRRRVGRNTEKFGVWKQRKRSSERGLMPWKRRKECKEGRVSFPEEEEIRKMCGESSWKSKMRPES